MQKSLCPHIPNLQITNPKPQKGWVRKSPIRKVPHFRKIRKSNSKFEELIWGPPTFCSLALVENYFYSSNFPSNLRKLIDRDSSLEDSLQVLLVAWLGIHRCPWAIEEICVAVSMGRNSHRSDNYIAVCTLRLASTAVCTLSKGRDK